MSEARRLNRAVYDTFMRLAGADAKLVDVGELAEAMRALDLPMGAWQLRGELQHLRQQGLVELDADTARWRPAAQDGATAARAAG